VPNNSIDVGSGVGISKAEPPRLFVLPPVRLSIGSAVLSTTQRAKESLLPEKLASEPEAEVTVKFGLFVLLNNTIFILCAESNRFTVPVRAPVVPPVPVKVRVNGVLETVKLPGVVWVRVAGPPVSEKSYVAEGEICNAGPVAVKLAIAVLPGEIVVNVTAPEVRIKLIGVCA
jgi:hypothetical protein